MTSSNNGNSNNGSSKQEPGELPSRSKAESMQKAGTLGAGGLLTVAGLSRGGVVGLAMAAVGSDLLYGGIRGRSFVLHRLGVNNRITSRAAVVPHKQSRRTEFTVTINRPRQELYSFWRDFNNLQSFMPYIETAEVIDHTRSRWAMTLPTGRIQWEAEIHNEIEGELIAWRSLPGSDISNAGTVRFKDGPPGRGTEVTLIINFEPPMGALGKAVVAFLPQDPGKISYETLHRLKQLMEAGEIATGEMRPGLMANQASAITPQGSTTSAGSGVGGSSR